MKDLELGDLYNEILVERLLFDPRSYVTTMVESDVLERIEFLKEKIAKYGSDPRQAGYVKNIADELKFFETLYNKKFVH